jgi:hypothetical protein
LNPTNIKQVKSLGYFIKQSLELRTGGTWFHLFYCVWNLFICCTLYVYVLLTIQCSHWLWLGWKLWLIKFIIIFIVFGFDQTWTQTYDLPDLSRAHLTMNYTTDAVSTDVYHWTQQVKCYN